LFPLDSAIQKKYPFGAGFIGIGHKELASSPISRVASAHPVATNTTLEMLNGGGNAVDAAIAAMMVSAVLDTGQALAEVQRSLIMMLRTKNNRH